VRSIALIACISLIALLALLSPSILLRSGSTIDHFRRPIEAMKVIALNPFGLGLGSAGPAQNRVADACLDFPAGSDISWAKDRTDLCIFVDHVQRQPDISVRACRCPLLPENWYLQIGIELGIVGLVVYVILVVLILRRLHQSDRGHGKWDNVLSRVPYHMAHRVFLALSVAALFLHAFEDSAVSWTLWVLVAVILPIVWSRKAA
jgi:O-antigen ligase